jgi:hypothetical protein
MSKSLSEPRSMLFYRYSDNAIGRTQWIENHIADHLRDKFKKKAEGGRPIYVVRCKPRERSDVRS